MRREWMDARIQRWTDVVEYSDSFVNRTSRDAIVDIGCGPAGLFLALDNERVYCVDPLAEFYRATFPYLQDQSRLTWISDAFENASLDSGIRIVYSMNSIDHVHSLNAFMQKLTEILAPQGYFVVSINCFRNLAYRRLFDALGQLIDPDHPYHFTKQEFDSMLCERFEVLDVARMDEIITVREPKSYVPLSKRIAHAIRSPQHGLRYLVWKLSEIESLVRGRGKVPFYEQYLFIAQKKSSSEANP